MKIDRHGARAAGLIFVLMIAAATRPYPVLAVQEPLQQTTRVSGTYGEEPGGVPPPPLPAPEEEFRKILEEPVRPPLPAILSEPGLPTIGGAWSAQGPGPITNGQVEGISGGHVSGAIQTIVAHPTNADIVWIGAVNGGLWKTTNATNATPAWTPMGDGFASLSIGALDLDPTDGTRNTLVAGVGRFSSFSRVGGPRAGLLRTTNGGSNWTALTPSLLTGKNYHRPGGPRRDDCGVGGH